MYLYDQTLFQPLDLSVDNQDLSHYDLTKSSELARYIDSTKPATGNALLVGGYLEQRAIYQRSPHFTESSSVRNIHLGLDIWAAAGSDVPAIADGTIHSYADNKGLGNYGPTIIIHHHDLKIYSLYGHLSRASLDNLSVGESVTRGQIIGTLGDASVNGDYPPHLHLQIMRDLGKWSGDYPGVTSLDDLAYYEANCPDPMGYL
jgi:murein DD-endopeptidase MepM/ murein hydrolase activator NlpD